VAIENLGFVERGRSCGGADCGGSDVGGGPVVDIGLAGHHFEERGAGSGLVGRRGHWVQKARGERGVKLGETGREVLGLGLGLGRVVAVGGGGGVGEVHYRGVAPRGEVDPVGGGRFGQCRRFGLWLGLRLGAYSGLRSATLRGCLGVVWRSRSGDCCFSILASFGLGGLVLKFEESCCSCRCHPMLFVFLLYCC